MDELIDALRNCGKASADRCWNCDYYDREPWCESALANDAADALEAVEKRIDGLQKLVDINTERCEALRKQLREAHENYEKHLNELEAQIPKEGEWIPINWTYDSILKCSNCGELACCCGDYCPNCGAKMGGERKDGERRTE